MLFFGKRKKREEEALKSLAQFKNDAELSQPLPAAPIPVVGEQIKVETPTPVTPVNYESTEVKREEGNVSNVEMVSPVNQADLNSMYQGVQAQPVMNNFVEPVVEPVIQPIMEEAKVEEVKAFEEVTPNVVNQGTFVNPTLDEPFIDQPKMNPFTATQVNVTPLENVNEVSNAQPEVVAPVQPVEFTTPNVFDQHNQPVFEQPTVNNPTVDTTIFDNITSVQEPVIQTQPMQPEVEPVMQAQPMQSVIEPVMQAQPVQPEVEPVMQTQPMQPVIEPVMQTQPVQPEVVSQVAEPQIDLIKPVVESKFCPNCGNRVNGDTCILCGTKLN